jgi:hypothetical protein
MTVPNWITCIRVARDHDTTYVGFFRRNDQGPQLYYIPNNTSLRRVEWWLNEVLDRKRHFKITERNLVVWVTFTKTDRR